MKCKQHPNVGAAGKCSQCQAPLCQECLSDTYNADTGEQVYLCHDCAIKYNKRLQRLIILSIVLLVLVVVSFIVGIVMFTNQKIAVGIIIIAIVGAITNWNSIPYHVVVAGDFSFLRLIIKIFVSIVISPVSVILCIVNLVKLIKNYKNISNNNKTLK